MTEDLSSQVTGHISLRNGIVAGIGAYIAGLFTVLLMILSGMILSEDGYSGSEFFGQDYGAVSMLMESGMVFYSAHNAVMDTTGVPDGLDSIPSNYIYLFTDFLAGQINDVAEINIALYTGTLFGFKLLFVLIPAVIFITAYSFASGRRKATEPSYLPVLRGASLTAGYLPLAVIGSFVFTVEAPEVTWTPKLGSALVMVGLLYPVSFGSLGGAAAALVPRLEYSLKSSTVYGFLGGVVSIVGTLLLTFVAIDSTSADVIETVQTGLILHAYSVNFTIPATPTYALPKFLFGVIVLRSTVVAGSIASRNYRTSLRKSVASGASISLGFALVFMLALYLMLFPFQIEPVIVLEDELVLAPVKMWMYGGVLYPALVGGTTAVVEYYRH